MQLVPGFQLITGPGMIIVKPRSRFSHICVPTAAVAKRVHVCMCACVYIPTCTQLQKLVNREVDQNQEGNKTVNA